MDSPESYYREKFGSFHQRKINLVYNKLKPQFQAEIGVLFYSINYFKLAELKLKLIMKNDFFTHSFSTF